MVVNEKIGGRCSLRKVEREATPSIIGIGHEPMERQLKKAGRALHLWLGD